MYFARLSEPLQFGKLPLRSNRFFIGGLTSAFSWVAEVALVVALMQKVHPGGLESSHPRTPLINQGPKILRYSK